MPEVEYVALAKKFGGIPDYETLAKKFGGVALESKPVHHSSNDVEILRQSAENQSGKIGDAVTKATKGVPGAKLEAVRDSKDTERIEDKAERQGVRPSQIADIAAAKVIVPDQEAAGKVLKNLHQEMPIQKAEGSVTGEPQNNAVRQVQAVVDTGAPANEPVKKAEVLLQTPEMNEATEATHDKYRKAQELRAQGKEAEAAKLEQEITTNHETAEQAARARQGEANAIQKPGTGSVGERQQRQTQEAGNGRGRVEPGQQGQEASAQSTRTSEQKEKASGGTQRPANLAPIPPRRANERAKDEEVGQPVSPLPSQATTTAVSPDTSAGVPGKVGSSLKAPIPPSRLKELQAKLSTSAAPIPLTGNLKGQKVQVRTPSGEWKDGTILADNVMPGGGASSLRRMRGVFSDGIKFENVRPQDVRQPRIPDVAVDFDGTLAKETGSERLGEPLPERLNSVLKMIDAGKKVVVFTRRVENDSTGKEAKRIQDWLEANGLPRLQVTDVKEASEFYDNNAHHAPTDANTPLIKSNNARKK
jgi:hypothetical protein